MKKYTIVGILGMLVMFAAVGQKSGMTKPAMAQDKVDTISISELMKNAGPMPEVMIDYAV